MMVMIRLRMLEIMLICVQANLTKEQQKQLIAQMLTEVPLIDG